LSLYHHHISRRLLAVRRLHMRTRGGQKTARRRACWAVGRTAYSEQLALLHARAQNSTAWRRVPAHLLPVLPLAIYCLLYLAIYTTLNYLPCAYSVRAAFRLYSAGCDHLWLLEQTAKQHCCAGKTCVIAEGVTTGVSSLFLCRLHALLLSPWATSFSARQRGKDWTLPACCRCFRLLPGKRQLCALFTLCQRQWRRGRRCGCWHLRSL